MLAGAAQLAVKAEVGAVHRLGFLDASLLEEKGSQRMAGRLHPSPRLVIGQPVAELDRLAQVCEGRVIVTLPVFQFAVEHFLGHTKQINDKVVVWTRRLLGTRVFAAKNSAFSVSASATLPSAECATALA